MDQSTTEVRCPFGPQRLFMKLISYDDIREDFPLPEHLTIEFACSDCARTARREDKSVFRVLHRYSIGGEYLRTEIIQS